MALVSSIRHHDITNDYNDGANSLKNFLHYAEAVSKGDAASARRVLENLNPLSRGSLAPLNHEDAVVEHLAAALRARGYQVDLNVGQSRFRCDLAVKPGADSFYQLGILIDTEAHYANANLLDRYLMQPSILRAFGWRFALVLTKDWYHNPSDVLTRLEKLLQNQDATASPEEEPALPEEPELAATPGNPSVIDPPSQPGATAPLPSHRPDETTREAIPPTPAPPHRPSEPGPTSAAPVPASNAVRHFEFVGGSSKKFWEISQSGNSVTVCFGRIGTAGQSQTKTFTDEARARREAERLIAEKLKKGYTETKS
jgi:predicted DNA-binding WGR domain protein